MESEGGILQALAEQSIRYTRRAHPPVTTVAQARQFDGEEAETHAKIYSCATGAGRGITC